MPMVVMPHGYNWNLASHRKIRNEICVIYLFFVGFCCCGYEDLWINCTFTRFVTTAVAVLGAIQSNNREGGVRSHIDLARQAWFWNGNYSPVFEGKGAFLICSHLLRIGSWLIHSRAKTVLYTSNQHGGSTSNTYITYIWTQPAHTTIMKI